MLTHIKMYLILLQTQSATSAAFEIIFMLVGAAAIGIAATYLYSRSIYKKELLKHKAELKESAESLENVQKEVDELKKELSLKNKQFDQLTDDNNKLQEENRKLEKVYEASKSLYVKAVDEVDEVSVKLHEKENELKEKDAILQRIAVRKHLLNYDSFGTANEEDKDDLKMISGVGPFLEEKLNMLDIYTFDQISKFTSKDIETVNDAIEFFPGRIERDAWVSQAIELARNGGEQSELLANIRKRKIKINYDRIGIARKDDADDLSIISGIGGWIQEKLNALDIYTFEQISKFTEEDENSVTEAIEFFPGRIDRDEWVPQAQELVYSGGKKTALFERMKMKKHKIDYAKIGIAHKEDAQDLTEIQGIGPFIQEKLNFLDIYTFGQISKFTPVDVDTVTDIIEFFPGRIERDNWVSQAKELSKQVEING